MLLVQPQAKQQYQKRLHHFNTLYVVGSIVTTHVWATRSKRFQYIICCWFKLAHNPRVINGVAFQYIICCWFNQTGTDEMGLPN